MHIAARCNKASIAKFLVDWGADVNAKNKAGNIPLHWTVVWNACEVAKILISCSSDVSAKNKNGLTASERVLSDENFSLADILIEAEKKM